MVNLKHYIENLIQLSGKKHISEKILLFGIKLLQKKTLKKSCDILIYRILKSMAIFNVRSFR